MITFFAIYFLMLGFATFVCNGWFQITREGMIFQFWSKFWEKKTDTKRNYLEGEKLYKAYRDIEKTAQYVGYKGTVKYKDKFMEVDKTFTEFKSQIEHHLLIHLAMKEGDDNPYLYVYEEELIFRFPEYIRNPISSCTTCYSSVYGSTVFWVIVFLSRYNMFAWSAHPDIALIFTWFSFMISLAYINTFVHKKINSK